MEKLYYAGGSSVSFNCACVTLTVHDLDQLEADVKAGALPHTDGFFFGETDGTEIDEDLAFIAKAREAIAAGLMFFMMPGGN